MVTVFQIGIASGSWSGGVLFNRAGLPTTFLIAAGLAFGRAVFILLTGRAGER